MHSERLGVALHGSSAEAHALTEQQGRAYLVQEARGPGQEDTNLVDPSWQRCRMCVAHLRFPQESL